MATPLVATPPLSAVRARANHYTAARRRRNALVASVVLGLTVTGITKLTLTSNVDAVRMVGDPSGPETTDPSTTTTTLPLPGMDGQSLFLPLPGPGFGGYTLHVDRKCPTAVDRTLPPIEVLVHRPSMSATAITEPQPFDVVKQMFDGFNDVSSICGRAVELVDSTLDTVDRDAVAVLGLPLDPTLDGAIASRRLERAGIPVVGGDGLAASHHNSPVVYPVGTSAAALARMAAADAWSQGARTFAVVHDATMPFGREAADAMAEYVQRLGGAMKATIALDPALGVDPAASARYNQSCGDRPCDFVFLALLPDTAGNWLLTNPRAPRIGMSALPTLLTSGFADACFKTSNQRCDGLTAWSGFIPPFGEHKYNFEAVYAWGHDGAGEGSAMVEAAVISGRVLLEAIVTAGPDVTRATLRRTIEGMTFTSNVTPTMRWSPAAPRIGNPGAQLWRLAVDTAVRVQEPSAPDDDWGPDDATPRQERLPNANDGLPQREWHAVGTGWRSDPG